MGCSLGSSGWRVNGESVILWVQVGDVSSEDTVWIGGMRVNGFGSVECEADNDSLTYLGSRRLARMTFAEAGSALCTACGEVHSL
jgi:hypothetical protein